MPRRLSWAVTFVLLISACTLPAGEYSVSVNLPAPIVWGQTPTPAKATPIATYTRTPTVEPTPTQEIATWTPAPDPFTVFEVLSRLNVRSGAGLDYAVVDKLDAGELVEADHRIYIDASGFRWYQVYSHATGELLGWAATDWLQEFGE